MAGNTKLQLEISINYAENIESLNKEIEAMSKLPSLSKLKLGIDEDYIRDAVQNALNAKTFGIKVDPNISGGASGASGTPGGTKPPSSYQQQRNKIKLDSLNQEMIDQRRAKRQLADQKQLQQAYKFEIQ